MAQLNPKAKAVLLDFLERAGWSAGQVFVATLLAGGTTSVVTGLPWKYSLTLAASAAVSSIVLTGIQYLTRLTALSFWPDLLVRLGKTFLGSLAASFAAGLFNVTTFHWSAAINVAVLATLGALAKGLLAREHLLPAPAAAAGARPVAPGDGGAPVPPTGKPSPSTLPLVTYREATDR
jgi:hypothetical protein